MITLHFIGDYFAHLCFTNTHSGELNTSLCVNNKTLFCNFAIHTAFLRYHSAYFFVHSNLF